MKREKERGFEIICWTWCTKPALSAFWSLQSKAKSKEKTMKNIKCTDRVAFVYNTRFSPLNFFNSSAKDKYMSNRPSEHDLFSDVWKVTAIFVQFQTQMKRSNFDCLIVKVQLIQLCCVPARRLSRFLEDQRQGNKSQVANICRPALACFSTTRIQELSKIVWFPGTWGRAVACDLSRSQTLFHEVPLRWHHGNLSLDGADVLHSFWNLGFKPR